MIHVELLDLPPFIADGTGEALCAESDPDTWFPEKGKPNGMARRICRACVHRIECAEWAIDRGEPYGIWGDTSADERDEIRRQRGLPGGLKAAA